MTVTAYAPVPCGHVQGRRGRCSRLATKSWKVPRISRRRGTIYFHVSRCDQHPPRNGESSEPIEYPNRS
jgi:hypothetical protein